MVKRPKRQTGSKQRKNTTLLAVECLEDRVLPAPLYWTGKGEDALWSNIDNWGLADGSPAPLFQNNIDSVIFSDSHIVGRQKNAIYDPEAPGSIGQFGILLKLVLAFDYTRKITLETNMQVESLKDYSQGAIDLGDHDRLGSFLFERVANKAKTVDFLAKNANSLDRTL